jgi:hypothetical protein
MGIKVSIWLLTVARPQISLLSTYPVQPSWLCSNWRARGFQYKLWKRLYEYAMRKHIKELVPNKKAPPSGEVVPYIIQTLMSRLLYGKQDDPYLGKAS